MNLTIFTKKGVLYERECEKHIQRAHSVQELTNVLTGTGFEVKGVYEAFTVAPPASNCERIQFIAQKLA